jgi:polyisoprenyl-phosphate glycosyltransferase
VNALPEQHRVLRLVVPALNFPAASVSYKRDERAAGTSKYSLGHMVRLALDSVTAFSLAPLRFATLLGVVGALCAFGILLFALISQFVGSTIPGWSSLVGTIAGVGAVQLLCIGLLGEYVGRVYIMLQARPTYSIAYDSLSAESPRDLGPDAADVVAATPAESRPRQASEV